MGGMPLVELDELSCSALNELCNMIMGNSATIFSTLEILIDITPPIFLRGSKLEFQSDIQALKIPLLDPEGTAITSLYVCITQS
jgi:chemotaxis protein CheX